MRGTRNGSPIPSKNIYFREEYLYKFDEISELEQYDSISSVTTYASCGSKIEVLNWFCCKIVILKPINSIQSNN